jgi:hypothetical protein
MIRPDRFRIWRQVKEIQQAPHHYRICRSCECVNLNENTVCHGCTRIMTNSYSREDDTQVVGIICDGLLRDNYLLKEEAKTRLVVVGYGKNNPNAKGM